MFEESKKIIYIGSRGTQTRHWPLYKADLSDRFPSILSSHLLLAKRSLCQVSGVAGVVGIVLEHPQIWQEVITVGKPPSQSANPFTLMLSLSVLSILKHKGVCTYRTTYIAVFKPKPFYSSTFFPLPTRRTLLHDWVYLKLLQTCHNNDPSGPNLNIYLCVYMSNYWDLSQMCL